MTYETIILKFQDEYNLSDKQMTLINSVCCLKSKIETMISKGTEEAKIISLSAKNLEKILSYKDDFLLGFKDIDVKDYKFSIEEFFVDADFTETEFLTDQNYISEVINEIQEWLILDKYSDDSYGLDNNKFMVHVFKKNGSKFYAPVKEMDMKEFFDIYYLNNLFELKDSTNLKKEFAIGEINLAKEQIKKAKFDILFYENRISEIELEMK